MKNEPVSVGEERRHLLKLAWPMMGTQLLWMSLPLIDNVMVGALGAVPLAAMATYSSYYMLIFLISLGILSAINPLVSQNHGAGTFEALPSILHSSWVVAFCLGLCGVGFAFLSGPLLRAMGQSPLLIEVGWPYLAAVSWGILPQFLFLVTRQFADGVEDPIPTICLVAIAALGNLILDYAWIHGKWGFPAMGVAGAGYATAAMNWFLFLSHLAYFFFSERYQAYGIWEKWQGGVLRVKELFRIGLPSSGSMIAEMGYFSGSVFVMGWIGAPEVAGHQIALNAASLAFMVPLGLGFAASVRAGHHAGVQNWEGVRVVGKLSLTLAGAVGFLNALILFCGAQTIAELYTRDPIVVVVAVPLLRIAGIFQIFDGLQVMGIQLLRGLKDTAAPFLASMVSYWVVGMPLSLAMTFILDWGPQGFWMGMIASLGVAALLHRFRFIRLVARFAEEAKRSTSRGVRR